MNIGVGHQLDNDKNKSYRSQYRRKRREYFHNEEREERIKREREALKQQVAKENNNPRLTKNALKIIYVKQELKINSRRNSTTTRNSKSKAKK